MTVSELMSDDADAHTECDVAYTLAISSRVNRHRGEEAKIHEEYTF